jgi:hypothetical protein
LFVKDSDSVQISKSARDGKWRLLNCTFENGAAGWHGLREYYEVLWLLRAKLSGARVQ